MITPFIGGFLFHPSGLELSGENCKNACKYCFANLNKPGRGESLKSAIKQLAKKKATNNGDVLLNAGHSICLSNRSDPFSKNNFRESLAFVEHLKLRNNGLFIQTKTGEGMDETIERFMAQGRKDVVLYVTLTSMDDNLSKRIEAGATPPSSRLEVIKKWHQAGLLVIVALNPLVEQWFPEQDINRLIAWCKKIGLKNICLEMLNITHKQAAAMSANTKKCLGVDVLEKRKDNQIYVRHITELLIQKGFEVAKKGMPFPTMFFETIGKILPVSMPVLQTYINYLIASHKEPTQIYYDSFAKIMATDSIFRLRYEGNALREYLLRSSFSVWLEQNETVNSYGDILRLNWNDRRLNTSLQHHCLIRATDKIDNTGNKILLFDPTPFLGFDSRKKEVIKL